MSHPDDTGNSAVGKALSAIRRLRRPTTGATVEPSPAADQSVAPAPRANTEDASAVTPSEPADIPGTTDPEEDSEAVADDDPAADEPEAETSAESTEAPDGQAIEPESDDVDEAQDAPGAVTPEVDLDDDPENAENEIPSAETDAAVVEEQAAPPVDIEPTEAELAAAELADAEIPVDEPAEDTTEAGRPDDAVAPVVEEPVVEDPVVDETPDETEPISVVKAPAAEPEDTTPPVAADPDPEPTDLPTEKIAPVAAASAPSTADDANWRSDSVAPQYIPPATTSTKAAAVGRSRRVVLWVASIVVIVVAIAAVVIALVATRGEPAKPDADQAADAATTYTTALSNGDLSTLRSITCGERKQFYDTVSDEAFRQQFETQKANNELVDVRGVKAARVDGSDAVVEVTAFNTGTPEKTTDVALRLRKDGDDWKVCTAG
ncbi:hypothetical protein [Williamsia maris]|uniref:DUF4878 domain-containing protein n=1 Tax=Williamsia maris TaxID=72806 RepID=A0ABT1HHV5_9NOCA|nr:hypothetical protein [Williamsia maris]MCP2176596.1 hypothetical protein [Williamsia maris]